MTPGWVYENIVNGALSLANFEMLKIFLVLSIGQIPLLSSHE